jgi:NitT/TauT family transport system permease protein
MSLETSAAEHSTTSPRDPSKPASTLKIVSPWRGRLLTLGLQLMFLLVVLAAWQLTYSRAWVNPTFISNPIDIVQALWHGLTKGQLLSALGVTMRETILGFLLSVVLGMGVALLLYQVPLLYRATRPYITALNNLPRLALAPLFVLWFGIDSQSRIALIISFVFFVVLLNTYAGLQNSNRDYLLLAKALGAGRIETFGRFVLPSATPTIFAGLQLGLTYSFLGAIIGEILSGGSGLGAQIAVYQATFDTASMFADLVLMAVIATALSSLMRALESWILRWRRYELRGLA